MPSIYAPASALRLLKRQAGRLLAYLLAALALLGGAAFQMRLGGSLGPQLYAAQQPQAAPDNAAARALAAQSYCGLTRWPGLRPPAQRQHYAQKRSHAPGTSDQGSHHHGAHCPFCVTQAFAGGVASFQLPATPPDFLPAASPQALQVWLAAPRHADARAPPA